jgi:general L-amino acid transport system substrate-binding protein
MERSRLLKLGVNLCLGVLAVSKQPSKIDFKLIDDAIMKCLAKAFAIAIMLAFGAQAAWAQTLKAVQDRGQLICGANGVLAGFGMPDPQGNWIGFDVDYCRAMAAAIFNDPTKVKFVPLTAQNRFTALQSGEVDVLARNTTWTMSRDTTLGVDFAAVNYYDGQGFMVRKSLNINSALQLNDAAVCVQQGTTTELNLADYFRSNNMFSSPLYFTGPVQTTGTIGRIAPPIIALGGQ